MHMQRAFVREKLQAGFEHLLFAIVVYGGLVTAAAIAIF